MLSCLRRCRSDLIPPRVITTKDPVLQKYGQNQARSCAANLNRGTTGQNGDLRVPTSPVGKRRLRQGLQRGSGSGHTISKAPSIPQTFLSQALSQEPEPNALMSSERDPHGWGGLYLHILANGASPCTRAHGTGTHPGTQAHVCFRAHKALGSGPLSWMQAGATWRAFKPPCVQPHSPVVLTE